MPPQKKKLLAKHFLAGDAFAKALPFKLRLRN